MSDPLHVLKASLLKIYPDLKEEEWHYLSMNCELMEVSSKHQIIKLDQIQRHIYFLTSGLVRGYYINELGEEISIRFVNDRGWVTHYSALITGMPSKYIFQTLESSSFLRLPYLKIQNGYAKFKGLEKFGRLVAEDVLKTMQKRIEGFQFLTAEERYLKFVEDHPALFNRVSISHLSTYLGIKRQSLTRIRKKIATRLI